MSEKQTFRVKTEHLKLLREMWTSYIGYVEHGAPCIDPKRPYGNSNVYGDMAEILGIFPEFGGDDPDYSQEQIDYMDKLHREMETVLQILIKTAPFTEGEFVADMYRNNWKRA